jgi:HEPN domain-containing protein
MADEKEREVQAWLRKADDDLRSAQVDLAADPPLIEDALFHCQQAAEKAMKAFLTAHDTSFRKTHDLDELAAACGAIDASLNDELDPARDLTVFAWAFRYPGADEPPPETEAHESLTLAQTTVAALRERLRRPAGM